MPDVEENKTVDIDTSGPGAEIELENESKETESPEVETSTEETTETKVEATEEKKEEPAKEEKEKELEQYSESVQRRIAKLTHKWREAQRQADDAAEFARAQIKLKEAVGTKLALKKTAIPCGMFINEIRRWAALHSPTSTISGLSDWYQHSSACTTRTPCCRGQSKSSAS